MKKNKQKYRLVGVFIIFISSYWIIKIGYHLISYESTGGIDKNIYSHPKIYREIVLIFIFWLIQLLGGIGLYITTKTGLKIALIPNLIAGIFSLIYTIFITTHKLSYSSTISTNGIDKEMTIPEKWRIIYYELLFYILLTTFVFVITFWIIKRLKLIKIETRKVTHNKGNRFTTSGEYI